MLRLVSVVIPTYNRRALIAPTVDSVLAQTYRNLEVIVVDDGSTDGTGDLIRSLYAGEPRVRYVWQANAERAVARNHAIRLAQGEYVAFVDSDDLWEPIKLQRQVDCLEAHPEIMMVHTGWAQQYDDGTRIPFILKNEVHLSRDLLGILVFANMIGSATPLVRRWVFERIGGFNEDRGLLCFEDWELWTRIATLGYVDYVPDALAIRRVHEGNTERPLTPAVYGCFVRSILKTTDRRQRDIVRGAARERVWTEIRAAAGRRDLKVAMDYAWTELLCLGIASVAADAIVNRRVMAQLMFGTNAASALVSFWKRLRSV